MTSDQRYRALVIAVRARDEYVLAEWEAVLSREDLKDERFEGLQQEVRLLADLTREREPDLEEAIRALLERHETVPEDSAERRFIARQLTGLRYSCEKAGPIIESLSPFEWFADSSVLADGAGCTPFSAVGPKGRTGRPGSCQDQGA